MIYIKDLMESSTQETGIYPNIVPYDAILSCQIAVTKFFISLDEEEPELDFLVDVWCVRSLDELFHICKENLIQVEIRNYEPYD